MEALSTILFAISLSINLWLFFDARAKRKHIQLLEVKLALGGKPDAIKLHGYVGTAFLPISGCFHLVINPSTTFNGNLYPGDQILLTVK